MTSTVELPLGTLAQEFSLSRDVLRRLLAEAGVTPSGKRSGHPVYRLRDVLQAVQRGQQTEQMSPYARHALAKALLAEDEIRLRRGELLERHDVEQEQARILRLVALNRDTLPDILERDAGLSAAQVAIVERVLDREREELYRALRGDDEPAAQGTGKRNGATVHAQGVG